MKGIFVFCGVFAANSCFAQANPVPNVTASPSGDMGQFRFGKDYVQAFVRVVNMPQGRDSKSVLLTISTLNKTPLDFRVAIEPKQNQKFSSFGEFLVVPAVALNGKLPLRITAELRTKKNISKDFGLIQGLLTTATNIFTGGALSTISTLNRYSSATVDLTRDYETRTEVTDTNQVIVFDDEMESILNFRENYVFTFTNGRPTIDAWDTQGNSIEIQEGMLVNVEKIETWSEGQQKSGKRIPRFKLTYKVKSSDPQSSPQSLDQEIETAKWKKIFEGVNLGDGILEKLGNYKPTLNMSGDNTSKEDWVKALGSGSLNGPSSEQIFKVLQKYGVVLGTGFGYGGDGSGSDGKSHLGSGVWKSTVVADQTNVAYCDESQPFIIVSLRRYARYPEIRTQILQIEQLRENFDAIFHPVSQPEGEDAIFALIKSELWKMSRKLRILTDAGDLSLYDASEIIDELGISASELVTTKAKVDSTLAFSVRLSQEFWKP